MLSWGFHRFETTTNQWPSIQGKVVVSEVMPFTKRNIKDAYTCAITYAYVVNNKTFTKKASYYTSHAFTSRVEAENVIKQYPLGAVVSISYNPQNPYEAVEKNPKGRALLPFLLYQAAFWSLLGFVLLFIGIMIARPKGKNGIRGERSIGVTVWGIWFILSAILGPIPFS